MRRKFFVLLIIVYSMIGDAISQSGITAWPDESQVSFIYSQPSEEFDIDCAPPLGFDLDITYTFDLVGNQNKFRFWLYRKDGSSWTEIYEWTHYRNPYGISSGTRETQTSISLLSYPGMVKYKVAGRVDNGVIGGAPINSDDYEEYEFTVITPDIPTNINLANSTLINNQYYEVCSSNPIRFTYDNCLWVHNYKIERVDQNFQSLSPVDIVTTNTYTGNGGSSFTIPGNVYNFQAGEYYKIIVQIGAPSSTETFLVHYKQNYDINTNLSDLTICSNENQVITASGWTGAYTWSPSTYLSSSSGSQVTLNNPLVSQIITVTNANGESCVTPAEIDVTVKYAPSIDISNNPTEICDSETPVQFNSFALPAGGAGSWSGGCAITSAGVFDPVANGCNVAGYQTYDYGFNNITYTYTTAEGCSNSESFAVTYHKASELNLTTSPTCAGLATGSAAVNPTGNTPFSTPQWTLPPGNGSQPNAVFSNGNKNVDGIFGGNGEVSVIDSDGCLNSESFVIAEPPPVIINTPVVTDAPCSNGSFTNQFGSVDFSWSGGTPPYTISLDGGGFFMPNGTNSHNGASFEAGTHTFQVKDANGCITPLNIPYTFNVGAVTNFEFTNGFPNANPAQCRGIQNGSIEVSVDVSGGNTPYQIVYQRGSSPTSPSNNTSHTFSGLARNTNHLINVTEQTNGCSLFAGPLSIGNATPNPFTVEFNPVTAPSCAGVNNGALTATPTGGQGPYQYQWNTGSSTQTITGLFDGLYRVTVTETTGPNAGCKVRKGYVFDVAANDQWPQKSNGEYTERGEQVITDDANNVYVLGTFVHRTTLLETNLHYAPGATGYFIAKYSECGELLWVSYPQLASGSTNSTNFTTIDLVLQGGMLYAFLHTETTNYDDIDILVEPASSSGTITGPSGTNYTVVLELDPSDGGFSAAEFIDELNYSTNDRYRDVESVGSDFYLAGRKSDVAEIHEYQFGGGISVMVYNQANGSNVFEDIEYDAETATWFAVGNTTNSLDFGNSVVLNAGGPTRGFILKLTNNFTPNQVRLTCEEGCTAVALEIGAQDNSSAVWVAGMLEDPLLNNMYIRATNSNLVVQWNSSFDEVPGITSAEAVDLVLDENNHLIATGNFMGNVARISANGSGIQTIGDGVNSDLWFGSFIPNTGQCEWLLSAKSQEEATAVALATNNLGSNFAVGSFRNEIDFYSSSEPNLEHLNPGNEAMFTIRFGAPNGNPSGFYKQENKEDMTSESPMLEEKITQEPNFSLYPNPARDQFTLVWTPTDGMAEMQVFDIRGNLVEQRSLDGQQGIEEWNISNLSAGTYIVTIRLNEKTWQERLVKY